MKVPHIIGMIVVLALGYYLGMKFPSALSGAFGKAKSAVGA